MGDRKVAFTAVADHGGRHGPFCEDKTVVFNNSITNIGAGYNPDSGIFTAPVTGVYYFTFFFHAGGEHKSELSLIKDGEIVVTAADSPVSNSTHSAGNAAVLDLKEGDKVFVRLPANTRVWAANKATTFSGFLIRENSVRIP